MPHQAQAADAGDEHEREERGYDEPRPPDVLADRQLHVGERAAGIHERLLGRDGFVMLGGDAVFPSASEKPHVPKRICRRNGTSMRRITSSTTAQESAKKPSRGSV